MKWFLFFTYFVTLKDHNSKITNQKLKNNNWKFKVFFSLSNKITILIRKLFVQGSKVLSNDKTFVLDTRQN